MNINLLHTSIGKNQVDEIVENLVWQNYAVKDLIDITFHQNDQVAFRASWILENIYISYPDHFMPTTVYFLDRFAEQNNLSCRRHYGKILALMTHKKAKNAIKDTIKTYQTDHLTEAVFAWLIDEKTPVAVKSHCLNILANLSEKHPWIKDELIETMDFLVNKESVAFFAKVKQVRKQLKA